MMRHITCALQYCIDGKQRLSFVAHRLRLLSFFPPPSLPPSLGVLDDMTPLYTYDTPWTVHDRTVDWTVVSTVVRRIDFRELVRDLFSLYKTRIWMQQLEPETTPSGGPMQTPYSPQEMHGMPDGMARVGGGGSGGSGGSIDMGGMNMSGPML